MKRKRKLIIWSMILALLMGLIQPLFSAETYEAATSYTNAKEFYESTARVDRAYHAEAAYGRVYYATQAKLAYSSTNTRYYTVGFDVTLSGNGYSVSFTVQRSGGSMTQVGEPVKSGNYEYNLYVITEDKLFELATKADRTNAAYVLSASSINVKMDAIMTTISAGKTTPNGGIRENDSGGFTNWGTIYRLKNSTDLKAIKGIFSGHSFESYKEIYADLDNYLLNVRYAVNGTPSVSENSSTRATVSSSYKLANRTLNGVTSPYVLHNSNGSLYLSSGRTLNKITLLNPGSIELNKTGYHLPDGKEWITEYSIFFAGNKAYQSTDINPDVGYKDSDSTLYANWQPNTIKIYYNANGGTGTMTPTNTVYDKTTYLKKCSFTNPGYTLKKGAEWNTRADGNGISYSDEQLATNIIGGGDITLYAQWVPCVYKITLDKQGGSGATDEFYLKYKDGFYSDASATNAISSISIPYLAGMNFLGYYTKMFGAGVGVVDLSGAITGLNTLFTSDTVIFANWTAKQSCITFDKNGGTGGTDMLLATYGKMLPSAVAPARIGYTFGGYYLEETYLEEEMYYSHQMTPLQKFLFEEDITVHAKWADDIPPEVSVCAKPDGWTNQADGVQILVTAQDLGTGLSKVTLYCEDTPIVTKENRGGTTEEVVIMYTHTEESSYLYKVVAVDMEGNTTEAFATVKYDITPPNGEYEVEDDDPYNFTINVDVWDYLLNP